MDAHAANTTQLREAFCVCINELRQFDSQNQAVFSSGSAPDLTLTQLHMLVEAVFFRAYRSYERFVRDVFLSYCIGGVEVTGMPPASFLRPRDVAHAEQLLKSDMRYLDWSSPDGVVKRVELYLGSNCPIKAAYTQRLSYLRDCKHIRNYIAHSSVEASGQYMAVVGRYYGATPLVVPEPGEYLLLPQQPTGPRYLLQVFLDMLNSIAGEITTLSN